MPAEGIMNASVDTVKGSRWELSEGLGSCSTIGGQAPDQ